MIYYIKNWKLRQLKCRWWGSTSRYLWGRRWWGRGRGWWRREWGPRDCGRGGLCLGGEHWNGDRRAEPPKPLNQALPSPPLFSPFLRLHLHCSCKCNTRSQRQPQGSSSCYFFRVGVEESRCPRDFWFAISFHCLWDWDASYCFLWWRLWVNPAAPPTKEENSVTLTHLCYLILILLNNVLNLLRVTHLFFWSKLRHTLFMLLNVFLVFTKENIVRIPKELLYTCVRVRVFFGSKIDILQEKTQRPKAYKQWREFLITHICPRNY